MVFKKIFGAGKKAEKTKETNIFKLAKQAEAARAKGDRKPAAPQTASDAPPPQSRSVGHDALLAHLNEKDTENPVARLQVAGKAIFQHTTNMVNGLGGREGVRIEDVLAILGATGGYSVILAVLTQLKSTETTPAQAGMQHVRTTDGSHYYFGDYPNHILLKGEMPILGLTLGMVQELGHEVDFAFVNNAFENTAETIGTPEFGTPRLPEAHRPVMHPAEMVRHLWPKINEGLDHYQINTLHKPTVIGFAIQEAMIAGKDVIDPVLAAKIVVECAVPMAKLDPAEVDHPE